MKNKLKYLVLVVLINLIGGALHQFFQTSTKELAILSIPKTYGVNTLATIVICGVVIYLKDQFETTIGYIFFGLSVLKMIFFFIIINPSNQIGKVATIDAITFFVPYLINMVVELILIVKQLNMKDLVNTLKK